MRPLLILEFKYRIQKHFYKIVQELVRMNGI